jgi:hypothetical protein
VPDAVTLCLGNGRLQVRVRWQDFQGQRGEGQAVPLSGDTGTFWFFHPDNVELVVKALDGTAVNGHSWFFYGALSNVAYSLDVVDTATGEVRTYFNPSGSFASRGDTRAFEAETAAGSLAATPERDALQRMIEQLRAESGAAAGTAPRELATAGCTPSETALCLGDGRFLVRVEWEDFAGNRGAGRAVALSSDTGYFWFFNPNNVELITKALDGTAVNGNHWFFYGALSNVKYQITVTDTATGRVKTYDNPSGRFASAGDTEAFVP